MLPYCNGRSLKCKGEKSVHLSVLQHGQIDNGPREPQPEQALAHGGHTLVEHAKNAEALLGLSNSHRRRVLFLLRATKEVHVSL